MQQHNKNQSKKYQSITALRIRRSGKKEADYSDALGNKKKVGRDRSGWEYNNCLAKEWKPNQVLLYFFSF